MYHPRSGGGSTVMTSAQATASVVPQRKQRNTLSYAAFGCSVLALVFSMTALSTSFRGQPDEPQTPPVIETEKEDYEYIVYRDKQIPIQENVERNRVLADKLGTNQYGWLTYEADGVSGVTGIDVSAHQGEIDWTQVADSGVKFAIVRVGYRGYGEEGKILLDANYRRNIEGALNAGLEVGVYFFSQATSIWEVEEELEILFDAIEGYNLTYPVVFDWEHIHNVAYSRTKGVSGESISRMADFFCQTVEQEGYTPAVYFNQDLAYLYLDLERVDGAPFWLAEYDTVPDFYYHFEMWQYSSTGKVPGIEGNVDLSLAFPTYLFASSQEA